MATENSKKMSSGASTLVYCATFMGIMLSIGGLLGEGVAQIYQGVSDQLLTGREHIVFMMIGAYFGAIALWYRSERELESCQIQVEELEERTEELEEEIELT